jgi:hypothetical protein
MPGALGAGDTKVTGAWVWHKKNKQTGTIIEVVVNIRKINNVGERGR